MVSLFQSKSKLQYLKSCQSFLSQKTLYRCRLGRPSAVHADSAAAARRAGGGRQQLLRRARRHRRGRRRRPHHARRRRPGRTQPHRQEVPPFLLLPLFVTVSSAILERGGH